MFRRSLANHFDLEPYEYDGLNRRTIKKKYATGTLDETRHFYYSDQWQVLEERVDTSSAADKQYVWGTRYVDDLVLQDKGSTRHYSLQDALFNVVAMADDTGAVKQRFAYQPYGESEELNPNFTTYTGTDYNWNYRFTGRELDLNTGLQLNRNRFYHQQLGRWLSRDPIGYRAGRNLYGYVGGRPAYLVDPRGLMPPNGAPRFYTGGPRASGVSGRPAALREIDPYPPRVPGVTELYCRAARKYPRNGWLQCACDTSGDIDMALTALFFDALENGNDESKAKYLWFACTRRCIQKRWLNAKATEEKGIDLIRGSAWGDWCKKCYLSSSSIKCCKEQVKSEQTELANCFATCGQWKWGDSFPINQIPGFKGDFNDLQTRIKFGNNKCCSKKYYK